jgi:hypothetical protein
MIQGMVRQIAQKFAEGLRAMESMAHQKFFNLREVLGFLSHGIHRSGIVTPT